MREEEWRSGDLATLEFQLLTGDEAVPVSDRKLRLWAAACCRLCWELLNDRRSRDAVEGAERFADARLSAAELAALSRASREAYQTISNFDQAVRPFRHAALAADNTASPVRGPVLGTPHHARSALVTAGPASEETAYTEVRALLHDVFGNPFRPTVISAAWLAWDGGTVLKFAQAVYEERAFDRLPILADALEEAGCTDAELLGHLRGPGPHVRGCWALDVLLGRG
jgi:hypothetical protein